MATDITADQLIINKMTLEQFNALPETERDPTQVYVIVDAQPTGYIPIGTIVPFAGTNVPDGFLLCQGAEVSRTTYDGLFSVIGTTYGAGDGNSTFNLPSVSILQPTTIPVIGNGKNLQFRRTSSGATGNVEIAPQSSKYAAMVFLAGGVGYTGVGVSTNPDTSGLITNLAKAVDSNLRMIIKY